MSRMSALRDSAARAERRLRALGLGRQRAEAAAALLERRRASVSAPQACADAWPRGRRRASPARSECARPGRPGGYRRWTAGAEGSGPGPSCRCRRAWREARGGSRLPAARGRASAAGSRRARRKSARCRAASCRSSSALIWRSTSSFRRSPSSVRSSAARRSASFCSVCSRSGCALRQRLGARAARPAEPGSASDSAEASRNTLIALHIGTPRYRCSSSGLSAWDNCIDARAAVDVGGRRIGLAISDPSATPGAAARRRSPSEATTRASAASPKRSAGSSATTMACRPSWWGCRCGSTGPRATRRRASPRSSTR